MARTRAASNVAQLFDMVAPRATPEDLRIAEAMVFAGADAALHLCQARRQF